MKGVSGIVATAILLALTIAGGLLLYTYVSRYLAVSIQSGELIIENAYYLTSVKRLEVTVRNIGMSTARVTEVEVILANGSPSTINQSISISVAPGETKTISITDIAERPLYVIVHFDDSRKTEPAAVRVIG